MHEYGLEGSSPSYVLCRMRNNGRRKLSQPQPQVQNSNIDAIGPLRTDEQCEAYVSDVLLQRILPDVGGGHVSDITGSDQWWSNV